jgi:hypothetical protein
LSVRAKIRGKIVETMMKKVSADAIRLLRTAKANTLPMILNGLMNAAG